MNIKWMSYVINVIISRYLYITVFRNGESSAC